MVNNYSLAYSFSSKGGKKEKWRALEKIKPESETIGLMNEDFMKKLQEKITQDAVNNMKERLTGRKVKQKRVCIHQLFI